MQFISNYKAFHLSIKILQPPCPKIDKSDIIHIKIIITKHIFTSSRYLLFIFLLKKKPMKDTPCWDLFLQRVYKREERKTSKKNTMIKSCGGIAGCIYTNPSSQNQLTPPQFPVRKHRGKKGGENAQVCLYIHATAASAFVVSSLFIIPTFIFLFYSRWLVVRLLKPA